MFSFWTKLVSASVLAIVASLAAQAASAQARGDRDPGPEARVWIENDSATPRSETVRVSIPFAVGQVADVAAVSLGSFTGPAVPLLRWRDGSVKLAQAHVHVELGPRQRRAFPVAVADPVAVTGDWPFARPLPMHTELEDAWGQVYRAAIEIDDEPVLGSSERVRIRRVRGVHRRDGAEFLSLVGYLTEVRGESRGELTLVLDNGAYRPDTNFGPVRFRAFALVSSSRALRFRPRFATENAIRPALARESGYFQRLLGPVDGLYLGDFTAKSFRFDLFVPGDDDDAPAQRAAASEPLSAWPDLDWVRHTRAFGAHGGPAPVYLDVSASRWREWRAGARFGPFAGHGDPEDAAVQGTPRNGPCNLHNLLRWQSPDLLKAAETVVLQHTLRPTSGFVPRRPVDMVAFRRGLSDRSIERPHGFTPLDYEHFSVDLIHDYYWLTGDPLARDELRRAGIGLRRLLAELPFVTSRGEGWTMQAGALIAAATGDRELLTELADRVRANVLPSIEEPPTPVALEQPPHRDAFGEGEKFDAPWQMAALVHGLHAMYAATGDRSFADAAVRTARIMAGPGWLDDVGPKYLVSARQAGRYILPVGYAPMEGTARMEMGAFVLAAEMTDEPEDRLLFERRAAALARDHAPFDNEEFASNVWSQLFLDRRERP